MDDPGNLGPQTLQSRKAFTRPVGELVADDMHLGDVQIFINGVLAYSQGRDSLSYEHRGLTKDARAAIKVDSDNVLAIHCVRSEDKQWVDAGLDLRIPQD